jgi:hypothetical protein
VRSRDVGECLRFVVVATSTAGSNAATTAATTALPNGATHAVRDQQRLLADRDDHDDDQWRAQEAGAEIDDDKAWGG